MAWTERVYVAIPADVQTQANDLFRVIDPDTGGEDTFGEPNASVDGTAPATHCLTYSQFQPEMLDMIRSDDTSAWRNTLNSRADTQGRARAQNSSIQAVVPVILVDDAAAALQIVPVEPV